MTKKSLIPLLIACVAPSSAQVLLNPPKDASVITVDVNLVNILCAVRDKRGAYVKDLSKTDFEVREDGKRQQITHFARQTDTPLTIALLLDVSGSVMNFLEEEKQAAGGFFSDVLRPGDKAMLTGFASLIAVWQDLTSSVDELHTALDAARPFDLNAQSHLETHPRGGTLLYDAVKLVSINKLKSLPGRKTMVLITDGLDNGSIANRHDALQAAQEADAVVYAIHFGDEPVSYGIDALRDLAEPTGGRLFEISKHTPLKTTFDTIAEEMRNQYSLGYSPPHAEKDGKYHKLEVKLGNGLKPQARAGYYSH